MSQPSYQSLFQGLNPVQREAVETIEGPVMLMAGPGTGKTHVLAMRIAHIIHTTDTPAHAILALTFTESAAMNMRERVVKLIGKDGYYVNIMTFHAFCTDVLKSHPEFFPIDRQSEPLSELDKYESIQNILLSQTFTALKPFSSPTFYVRDCIQALSQLKREGVTPDEYEQMVKDEYGNAFADATLSKSVRTSAQKKYDKNIELVALYREYQSYLRARRRYDFDDMIALVVEAFQTHEDLLLEYQEKLHYFLVDEYQDTNTSQNHVVHMLAGYWGENANLFVVGDPHQSIYRFQGASIENTLEFVHTYPRARILTLETGYRCHQKIYDVASEVVSHNALTSHVHSPEIQKALQTTLKRFDGDEGEKISYGVFPSRTVELMYAAQEILRLQSSGVPLEDMAVLYRHNSDAIDMQGVLEKVGVAYEIEGGEDILQAEMIRQLLQLMKVVLEVRSGESYDSLFEALLYEWTPIQPLLAMKIAQSAGRGKMAISELVEKGYDVFKKHYTRDDVTPLEFYEAQECMRKIVAWGISDMQMIFTQWFEMFIEESGYLAYILKQENKIELVTNLNSLFREIKARVQVAHHMKLADFVASIDVMLEYSIHVHAEDLNVRTGAVHLSTVHKAKGREWKHVFMIHCQDGKWGNTRSRELIPLAQGLLKNTDVSQKEKNEDERRLFYVALTRASQALYITTSETVVQNNYTKHTIPCMFINEIPADALRAIPVADTANEVVETLDTLLRPSSSPFVRIDDHTYFADLVKNFSLSVTALNTYLENTDEFVKKFLLRVPRATSAHMAFGTAVHFALEQYNKARHDRIEYTKEQLIQDFTHALHREALQAEDEAHYSQEGADALGAYFDMYKHEETSPLYIERFFGYGMKKILLDDISLVGRVDRIDLIDAPSKSVRVIDYKTGKTKTMGEIFGTTQSSRLSPREHALPEGIRGRYKRQLLFYKLLAEREAGFDYTVVEGMFDFVQPDATSKKFVRRSCGLVEQDVNDLCELIREVMSEIRQLSFLKG